MEKIPTFPQKSLEGQNVDRRSKKKKKNMTRRDFLKWSAGAAAGLAAGGVGAKMIRAAETSENESAPKLDNQIELSSEEKIRIALENVDPKDTVEIKVKENGKWTEKRVALEEWAEKSWKEKVLRKVKRKYPGRTKIAAS